MWDVEQVHITFLRCKRVVNKIHHVTSIKIISISINRFSEDDSLCPCNTLEHYLEFLKTFRGKADGNQLLLSHREPHRVVCIAMVARWIKGVLVLAGIDISIFNAHFNRAASTFKAKIMGLSTKTYWKGEIGQESQPDKNIIEKTLYLIQKTPRESVTTGTFKQMPENSGRHIIYKKVEFECKIVWRFYKLKFRNYLRNYPTGSSKLMNKIEIRVYILTHNHSKDK